MLTFLSAALLAASLSVQQADDPNAAAAAELAENFDEATESPDGWAGGLTDSLVEVAAIASPEGRIRIDDPQGLRSDLVDIVSEVWPILTEGDGEQGEIDLNFDLRTYAAGEDRVSEEICASGSGDVAYEGAFEEVGPGTRVRICRGFGETPEGTFFGQAIVLTSGQREGVFIFTLVSFNQETGEPIADAFASIAERLAASVRFPG